MLHDLEQEKRVLLARIEGERRELHHRIYALRSSASPWITARSLALRLLPFFRPALGFLRSSSRRKRGGKLGWLIGIATLAAALVPSLRGWLDGEE